MKKDRYVPPFSITDKMVTMVSEISEFVGTMSVWKNMNANPRLRRANQIKTIHSSLAIENNSLTLEQVTDIVNGKRILGPLQDIQEVKNAFEVYEKLLHFDPYSETDLLMAHKILMSELVDEAGVYRSRGVGVYKGDKLVHMAPPASIVSENV